jgi:DNA invertase Pin-like site-specific DNA recombinase
MPFGSQFIDADGRLAFNRLPTETGRKSQRITKERPAAKPQPYPTWGKGRPIPHALKTKKQKPSIPKCIHFRHIKYCDFYCPEMGCSVFWEIPNICVDILGVQCDNEIMKYIGYHRVSTKNQHIDTGVQKITRFCTEYGYPLKKVYTDVLTGGNFERPRYIVMKEDVLEPGDCLIVTAVDRLGRNAIEMTKELQYYYDNDIQIMVLQLPTTLMRQEDAGSEIAKVVLKAVNKLLIEVLAIQAQGELEEKKTRQRDGVSAMKARGEWDRYGRPRKIHIDDFATAYKGVIDGEIRPVELMRQLKVSSSTFYRYVDEIRRN